MDWLVVLIIVFGVIALVMFVLFVISYKRHANDLNKKEEDNYESNDNNTNVEESSISSDSNTAVDEEKKEEAISDKSEDEVKDESENPAETQSQEEKLKANNSDEFSMYDVPDREIEVIVILVNNDMCIFDANNHVLAKGAYVRVFHNNYYEDGVVVKANTKVMLSTLEKVPEKLILENDNLEGVFPVKDGEIESDNNKEETKKEQDDNDASLFELKDEIKNDDTSENKEESKSEFEYSEIVPTDDFSDDIFIPKKKKKEEKND